MRQRGAQVFQVFAIETELGGAFLFVLDFGLDLYLGPEIAGVEGLAYGGLHLLQEIDGLIQ